MPQPRQARGRRGGIVQGLRPPGRGEPSRAVLRLLAMGERHTAREEGAARLYERRVPPGRQRHPDARLDLPGEERRQGFARLCADPRLARRARRPAARRRGRRLPRRRRHPLRPPMNRYWTLAKRPPPPWPDAGTFELRDGPIPTPAEGQALTRTIYVSLDPYQWGYKR